MNMKLSVVMLSLAALSALAGKPEAPSISGDYLEVRSCDVYTGPCFANAEMNLTGKEGIMVWSVREGTWNGTSLAGLSVIAVICTDGTLGDVRYQPRAGKAVLIVDEKADAKQREALSELARSLAGKLIRQVVEVRCAPIATKLGDACTKGGCAAVTAGNLVQINTRCLGGNDHFCGNEETYYPPLTNVEGARPVFTEVASYQGSGLNVTWEATDQRSAFLATFSH